MSDRRLRERQPKNSYTTSLHSPIPQNLAKKPKTKTENNFSAGKHLSVNSHAREIMPQVKKIKTESGDENKKLTSSSTSLSSKPLSEYVIPGPIPNNLEDIMRDDSLLRNFFADIPEIED